VLPRAAVLIALAGCSTVTPVAHTGPARVCIIESPRAKPISVVDEYRSAMKARGFDVQVLPAGSALAACPLTSKYAVGWSRDIGGEFISSVHLDVFKDGQHAGQAVWRSRVPTSMSSEQILSELVDKLYPR